VIATASCGSKLLILIGISMTVFAQPCQSLSWTSWPLKSARRLSPQPGISTSLPIRLEISISLESLRNPSDLHLPAFARCNPLLTYRLRVLICVAPSRLLPSLSKRARGVCLYLFLAPVTTWAFLRRLCFGNNSYNGRTWRINANRWRRQLRRLMIV
jgi:hypothetical protein